MSSARQIHTRCPPHDPPMLYGYCRFVCVYSIRGLITFPAYAPNYRIKSARRAQDEQERHWALGRGSPGKQALVSVMNSCF